MAPSSQRYLVPRHESEYELEIKRSRFITLVRRTETEEEARQFITAVRSRFPDARHHCTAYVLGPSQETVRSNDDGEPSGTAGRPMAAALTAFSPQADQRHSLSPEIRESFSVSDTAVVVVRYFGGVLLGAGGLTRAYSSAVSEALSRTSWLSRELQAVSPISVDHAQAGRFESELRSHGIRVLSTEYGVQAVLNTAVPAGEEPRLSHLVQEISAGTLHLGPSSYQWTDLS